MIENAAVNTFAGPGDLADEGLGSLEGSPSSEPAATSADSGIPRRTLSALLVSLTAMGLIVYSMAD